MATLLPFHGLLPTVEKADQVAAVPYDVVNSEEAAVLAEGNPLSFLRVSKPEIELEAGINLYSEEVYAKARENFVRLCAEAPLNLDEGNHLYIYELTMDGRTQVGILGAASAEDYQNEIIKKHERTRQAKEDDRTRHVMELRSHTGPVFLTYKDSDDINAKVGELVANEAPLFNFTAVDGITHKLWRVSEELSAELSKSFDGIDNFYIADGHHRAAAAARSAVEGKKNNPNHTGEEDYNFFLTVVFPASHLHVMSYNRVVKDLNGFTKDELFAKIGEKFTITESNVKEPTAYGNVCVYIDKKWYEISPNFSVEGKSVIEQLDAMILQRNILAPFLGIDDPRTSNRIDFIGGIRGTAELERLVDSGKFEIAFSMSPCTIKLLMAVADNDEIMPPKSTWFEPKLRDGLVCHNF